MSKPRFKRPESVLVVVVTTAGEVLMLRRTTPEGFWQSVTGSLRWDETPRRAAQRELWEETGLRAGKELLDLGAGAAFPIVPPWRERYAPSARTNREHWFLLLLAGRRLIRLHPPEHAEYHWLRWPRAAALASSWSNRDAILWLMGAPLPANRRTAFRPPRSPRP